MTVAVVDDGQPDSPDTTDPSGSMFEWGQGLFLNPSKGTGDGAVYDMSDYQARDVAAMLRRDPRASALDSVLRMPAMSSAWSITPADGDTGEAEDVKERLTRPETSGGMATPLQLVINQMTNARLYRKSFHELWWGLDDDGTTVLRDAQHRPASTCRARRKLVSGQLTGFEQDLLTNSAVYNWDRQKRTDGQPVRVPASRALVYVHGQDRDPVAGVSDVEIPFWCWRTKQKVIFLMTAWLEGQALPRTVVKSKEGEEKATQQARKVAKAKSSGVIALDENTDLDTLDVSGSGQVPYLALINYLDAAAANSQLAGFIDLPSQATTGSGSRALFNGASDFFLRGEQKFIKELQEAVQAQILAPLTRYNHGRRAAYPLFEFAPLNRQELQPVMEILMGMVASTDPAAPKVPREFFDEIVMRNSAILDLDTDKIAEGLKQGEARAKAAAALAGQVSPNAQNVAGVAGTVTAAAGQVVRQKLADTPKT